VRKRRTSRLLYIFGGSIHVRKLFSSLPSLVEDTAETTNGDNDTLIACSNFQHGTLYRKVRFPQVALVAKTWNGENHTFVACSDERCQIETHILSDWLPQCYTERRETPMKTIDMAISEQKRRLRHQMLITSISRRSSPDQTHLAIHWTHSSIYRSSTSYTFCKRLVI
jgi:hypothetical protein